LEADKKPRIRVMNKVDLLSPVQRDAVRDTDDVVHVSASKGVGLTTLLDRVDAALQEDPVRRVRLQVPQKEGKMLALLEAGTRIYSRNYKDGLVELEAEGPQSLLRKLQQWKIE